MRTFQLVFLFLLLFKVTGHCVCTDCAKEDTKRVNPLSFPVTSHRTVTGVSRGNGQL